MSISSLAHSQFSCSEDIDIGAADSTIELAQKFLD